MSMSLLSRAYDSNFNITFVDSFMRLDMHVIVLERRHALCQVREDVTLLDCMMHREIYNGGNEVREFSAVDKTSPCCY